MISKAQKIDFNQIVSDSLYAISPQLVKAQQVQMLRGENALDKKIGKYKGKAYRNKKFNLNPLAGYGNVDLKLTGSLHREIKIYFFSKSFFFNSTDPKTEKVIGRYGGAEAVFGLNKKFTKQVTFDYLTPEGIKRITKQLL